MGDRVERTRRVARLRAESSGREARYEERRIRKRGSSNSSSLRHQPRELSPWRRNGDSGHGMMSIVNERSRPRRPVRLLHRQPFHVLLLR